MRTMLTMERGGEAPGPIGKVVNDGGYFIREVKAVASDGSTVALGFSWSDGSTTGIILSADEVVRVERMLERALESARRGDVETGPILAISSLGRH